MKDRIHMIEPTGRGGIYQHALALALELTLAGADVVLHSAMDLERNVPELSVCRCFRWYRQSPHRHIRQIRTTGKVLGRTLPHLFKAIHPGEVVHIQGFFGLTPEIISIAKVRNATVVSSPHNTFVRSGSVGGARALAHALKRSDRVLVYSHADRKKFAGSSDVGEVPLVQWTPPVRPELVRRWREALSPENVPLAVLAGQVRRDKKPDLFVAALGQMEGWRGAIVGEDLGAGPEVDELVRVTAAPVRTLYGYLDLDEFVALIAAADVVVAPYQVASQSGVLAVASRLGIPTAVTATGGLGELASAVARDTSPLAVRDAILAAHSRGALRATQNDVALQYIREYELAGERRRRRKFVRTRP